MSGIALKRIGIVWYGVGNITSVARAVANCGAEPVLLMKPSDVASTDAVILPGVGAFGAAASSMRKSGLDEAVLDFIGSGGPAMGICLGMQLLFESSAENPGIDGLGVFEGRSEKLGQGQIRIGACDIRLEAKPGFKVPHTGWNEVDFNAKWPFGGESASGRYYFTHSYAVKPADKGIIAGTTVLAEGEEQPYPMVSAIAEGNVIGVQFHPEKSGGKGLELIKEFIGAAGGDGRVAAVR